MGYYINPPDMSKEEFLAKHGTPISAIQAEEYNFKEDKLPVCLLDNGAFTAAGIGIDAHEVQAFLYGSRQRYWYFVSKADLAPYYKED